MQRRPGLLPALLLALALTLTGCGAAPPEIGPTGVDELEIPTPSPDAADFVDGVDHPFLPLAPGSRWDYLVAGDPVVVRRVVEVLAENRLVAGVSTTGVLATETDENEQTLLERRTWYAQDAAGNVWTLAGEVVRFAAGYEIGREAWEATSDGAEAGVALLATPRVGDGYVVAYAEGVAEERARIVTLGGQATVPFGELSDLLETELTSSLEDATLRTLHAESIGLVREQALQDGRRVELVAFEPGSRS
ncbi:hypothetical protein [Nocardioides sp.]|uniref:hypothetical protein n=1 Tax=Nocardioides sp. TaxID=35761 RepID=UPI002734DEC4|nr:hypothetical protein [Nocardioides sp.]MDP3893288.1 hypothetical protein [Nocardioides sp.]